MASMAYLASALLAWLLTLGIIRFAERHRLIDRPNERSSHSRPTPRGGGLAVLLTFAAGIVLVDQLGHLDDGLATALYIGCGVIAPVGFLDDRHSLPASVRFSVHLLCAAAGVWAIGNWETVRVGGLALELGFVGFALFALGLTWLLNLYNFMDGIDALAAIETVFVCVAMAWLSGGTESPYAPVLLLLGSCTVGFLVLNWPPARVFMGDVGSSFIGFTLGIVMIHSSTTDAASFVTWAIVLGAFIVDATFTLIRRASTGQRFTEAHRTHAYQYAARRFGSHRTVSLGVLAINVIWLLPLAYASVRWPAWSPIALIVAYLPLVVVAYRLDAGRPEAERG